MKRRHFLAGLSALAGAGLCAPLLRQVQAGTAATRFVFLVEGNGIEPANLMTPGARAALAAEATSDTSGLRAFPERYGHGSVLTVHDDLAQAPSLGPLAEGGLDLRPLSQVVLGLSSTITGGGHSTYFGALSSTRSTPGRPGGPTIDALLAAQPLVRGNAPFDALRLGISSASGALNTTTCAFDEGRAAPVLLDPAQAFANLFGVVGDAASQAAFARKGLLLDYGLADTRAALSTFAGSSQERARLEQYLASLEAVQARQERLQALAPSLAGVAPPDPSVSPLYGSTDPFERLEAHVGLVEAALIGGLTHTAVLAVGTGGGFDLAYPSLIADFRRHDIHHMGLLPPDQAIPVISAATRALVAQAARLARALAAVPEAGGTMLDHTLIALLPGNGERHHSQAYEWPLLLIGGQRLGFTNDGRSTLFPGVRSSANRQLSNFFQSLGYAAGMELDRFGDEGPTRIAEGPLSELWSP